MLTDRGRRLALRASLRPQLELWFGLAWLKVVLRNYGEFVNVILLYTMRALLARSQAEQLDASSFKADVGN